MARSTTDLDYNAGELLQLGTIASVDLDAGTCTVDLTDLITGDLHWFASRAGGVKVWSPPSIGEQCAVLSPEGDLANGLVLLGLWSDANPAPSNKAELVLIKFPDGAILSYDHAAHALAATLPAGGKATIDAPAGLTISANTVTINADVKVNGRLTATDDVVGGGISLKGHKHSGVQSGGSQTGAPQ